LTSERQRLVVDGEPFEIAAHHCFACGTLNAHGLQLELHLARDRAWTEIVLDRRFEGWDAIAHGGIVATILDEVMAWSLIASDAWGMTARMNVAFRAPVSIGDPLRAEGRLVERRKRLYRTEARLLAADTDEILATADGTYLAAPPDRRRELQARYGFRRLATSDTPSGDEPTRDARTPAPARRAGRERARPELVEAR
jgi:acyl-coenzyme A thioesterase PaaI-like protein